MRFSQRIGKTSAQKIVQKESIDNDLRNGLWNVLTIYFWSAYRNPGIDYLYEKNYIKGSNFENLVNQLWVHFFKKPIDTIEDLWENCLRSIRGFFFEAEWYQVYDFIEFLAVHAVNDKQQEYINACNFNLERENSAYRFVEGRLVEITSDEEIQSVEQAIENASPYSGVKEHLTTALELMANRVNPDYRNAIKESISAVESLAKHISGDESATLGAVLKKLESERGLHPALKKSFSALYGYTSDADGIRHALMEEQNLTKSDARLMLVCCSAFVNYVIELISKDV